MKKLLISSYALLLSLLTYGQHENVWAFGNKAGIDFNYNPPQPFISSSYTLEGCASVCDATGKLLFYTNGSNVWDRTHNRMPDGEDLSRTGRIITFSCTQGALIIPVPNNDHQYYIFSLAEMEDGFYIGSLYYSIVDMNLNGGLGDVVPGKKGVLLDKSQSEQMIAVPGNHCNIWLLTVSRNKNVFKVFNINTDGIDTNPVLSDRPSRGGFYYSPLVWAAERGTIDASPNRRKVALALGSLALYDFDPDNGQLSNPQVLKADSNSYYMYTDSSRYHWSVAFSPDNSKLYASSVSSNAPGCDLVQYDLKFNQTDSIIASKTTIFTKGGNFIAMKRAPDQKIYCATGFTNSLDVIRQPNATGSDCQFSRDDFRLVAQTQCHYGFPNVIANVREGTKSSSSSDTLSCMNDMLLKPTRSSIKDVMWEDGSTDSVRTIDQPGTYWVHYQDTAANQFCILYIDTFTIVFDSLQTQVHSLQGMCSTDILVLKPTQTHAPWYQWDDGSTDTQRRVAKEGIYWVRYQFDPHCNVFVDTFIVQYPEKDPQVDFTVEPFLCIDHPFLLKNNADPRFDAFQWFFGNGDSAVLPQPDYAYIAQGSYEIMMIGTIGGICPDTAYASVEVDAPIPVTFNLQPARICTGQSITVNHNLSGPQFRSLHWNFGDGSAHFSVEPTLPHAYAIAGQMPVTLKARFRACPDNSDTDTIYVHELPQVHLGSDEGLCLKGQPLYLRNLAQTTSGIVHYLWSTGDTTAMIQARHPGLYSLKVSMEPLGCSTTESVTLTKDCYIDLPNAFTPNGDGINDYFFPRQLLSEGVREFKMQIWNRWGQVVFETTAIEGRGWDGQFNGTEQPAGVYVYRLYWRNKNGTMEDYKGNVTLLH